MKRTLNLLVTLLVITAVALAGCRASTPEETPTVKPATPETTPTEKEPTVEKTPTQTAATAPLDDTEWVLESYGEPGNVQAVLEGIEITARFDSKGLVSGSAGCNTYSGRFEVDGSRLSISDLEWTEIGCVEDVMEQEQQYLTALQAAESYQVQDGRLQVLSAGGQVLTFTAPAAEITLENTQWTLESFGEQAHLEAVLEGTEITAVFDSVEGRISGSAGCNTYSGHYEVDGSRLSISDLEWTEIGCVEDVMEQERRYLAALQAAESYQVQDGRLQILSAGGQVLTFAAPAAAITLENTQWTLESFSEQAHLEPVLEGVEITAVFDSVKGRVSGSAGCNSYFAAYKAEGTALSVSALGLTRMMCGEPAGVMEQEQKYSAALEAAESYLILGGKLLIFSSGARVLTFIAT